MSQSSGSASASPDSPEKPSLSGNASTDEAPPTRPTEPAPPQPDAPPRPDGGAGDRPPASQRVLRLRRGDQLVVGVLVLVALALMTGHWLRLSGWGLEPVEIERQPSQWARYRIDINSAGWIEWAQLQDIGRTLAQRIVEERDRNGPFESIDDLQRVKGIGPKTVERLRPWLRRAEDSKSTAGTRR